jgi:hypothetical protein
MPLNPDRPKISALTTAQHERPPPPHRRALSATNNASPLAASFGALIAEIAARLEPIRVILKRHNISVEEFIRLRHTPIFKAALTEQIKLYRSLDNVPNRVRLKAQLITETSLDYMYSIITQSAYPSASRVAAFAQVKQLTGMDRPDNVAPPQKFSLTINLDNSKTLTINSDQEDLSADRVGRDVPLLPKSDIQDTEFAINSDDGLEDELDAEIDEDKVSPPIQDRSWNSFTAKPGPGLDKPGPLEFIRKRTTPGSATAQAADLDDDY